MYTRFAILILGCTFSLSTSSQVVEPVGDMYDLRLQSFVIPNTTFSTVARNRPFDTIHLDTIYAGEFYRFRMRLADNSTRVRFVSHNLPRGMRVEDDGTIRGITYDQGMHYVNLLITHDTNVALGVLIMYVKGEPMQSYHPLLDSLFFYPNPFRDEANFEFYLDNAYRVSIKVFNSEGELIKIVDNNRHRPRHQRVRWDALDEKGERLDDGWYNVQFSVFDRRGFVVTNTRRMLKMTRNYQRFW